MTFEFLPSVIPNMLQTLFSRDPRLVAARLVHSGLNLCGQWCESRSRGLLGADIEECVHVTKNLTLV